MAPKVSSACNHIAFSLRYGVACAPKVLMLTHRATCGVQPDAYATFIRPFMKHVQLRERVYFVGTTIAVVVAWTFGTKCSAVVAKAT